MTSKTEMRMQVCNEKTLCIRVWIQLQFDYWYTVVTIFCFENENLICEIIRGFFKECLVIVSNLFEAASFQI